MPNRRRIGYMPGRRFDDKQNVSRQKAKRQRLNRNQQEPPGGAETVNFEEWKKEELYSLAREREIRGRSKMTKDHLIRSLRQTQ